VVSEISLIGLLNWKRIDDVRAFGSGMLRLTYNVFVCIDQCGNQIFRMAFLYYYKFSRSKLGGAEHHYWYVVSTYYIASIWTFRMNFRALLDLQPDT
jgi:hypothetical protein